MDSSTRAAPGLRERLGSAVFARVAGPAGAENRARIHGTPGPRWFGPDRPIRTVHGDASMFIGGLRALLLQSLHPLAMAAVEAHSGYRGDPWGRLTSTFLAVTTYGTADHARQAADRVRAVHGAVHGTTPSGESYDASDPHLLGWVHVAEVESFLLAHRRYGAEPLDAMRLRRLCRRHGEGGGSPRRDRPSAQPGGARRPARFLPRRTALHAGGARGGTLHSVAPAPALGRPRALRGPRCERGRRSPPLGPYIAGAAPAVRRERGVRDPDRACADHRDPLGDGSGASAVPDGAGLRRLPRAENRVRGAQYRLRLPGRGLLAGFAAEAPGTAARGPCEDRPMPNGDAQPTQVAFDSPEASETARAEALRTLAVDTSLHTEWIVGLATNREAPYEVLRRVFTVDPLPEARYWLTYSAPPPGRPRSRSPTRIRGSA